MLNVAKKIISIIALGTIISCTPSTPYEIRSPCVSAEFEDTGIITPCVRRPANLQHTLHNRRLGTLSVHIPK